MKKIDWTIWIGISAGLSVIAAGALFEELSLSFLWNPAAALIVGGGTLSAVLVKRGLKGIRATARDVWGLQFRDDSAEEHKLIVARLAWLARSARKNGLKTYEQLAEQIDDVLVSNAFVLLAENTSKERMYDVLKARIEFEFEKGMQNVRTIEAAGGYAPTFGILGAVIGLTGVLRMIDDPSVLGTGIAAAFVATIYGIALANLIFFPVASRLKDRLDETISRREEIASVLISLHENETPRAIINRFNLLK
ncbi:MAG: flagellar motor protein [Pyrinomonadaceae bacterium]|nr:flagellar motor protein [Pyrinomonadaceae bacterium]